MKFVNVERVGQDRIVATIENGLRLNVLEYQHFIKTKYVVDTEYVSMTIYVIATEDGGVIVVVMTAIQLHAGTFQKFIQKYAVDTVIVELTTFAFVMMIGPDLRVTKRIQHPSRVEMTHVLE